MKTYQVVGECAHVTIPSPAGMVTQLLYRPAILPSGVPDKRIAHLLSVGLIEEVGAPPAPVAVRAEVPAGPAAELAGTEAPPAGSGSTSTEADTAPTAVDEARAAAKAKLPADGSPPARNASTEVWVEYAVAQGRDYEAAKGESRDDLIALLTAK